MYPICHDDYATAATASSGNDVAVRLHCRHTLGLACLIKRLMAKSTSEMLVVEKSPPHTSKCLSNRLRDMQRYLFYSI